MRRQPTIDVYAIGLGLLAALAGGLGAYFALLLMAQPPNAPPRIAEVAHRADEVERMSGQDAQAAYHVAGAVCEGGADVGAGAVRQSLTTLASQSNVSVTDFEAHPQAPDEANGGLQPVGLVISGSGSADAVQALLVGLSRSSPSIFVDTLDLKPADGPVLLKLSGRIFCSPVHP